MEIHFKKLESICRLCAGKIKVGEGYRHAKEIKEYSDVLPMFSEEEDVTIYPKYLCNGCKKKLDRLRKGQSSKDTTEIAKFLEHSEINCPICEPSKIGRGRQSDIHSKVFDTAFSEIKFIKYPSPNEKVYFKGSNDYNIIMAYIKVCISNDGTWKLVIFNDIEVTNDNPLLETFPSILKNENINEFCRKLSLVSVCEGLKEFTAIAKSRIDFRDPFPGKDGNTAAWIESSKTKTKLLKDNFDVIRASNCSYVIEGANTCQNCLAYKKTLNVYKNRIAEKDFSARESEDSKTNFRYLPIETMENRLRNLAKAKRIAIQKAAKYSLKIDKLIKSEGVFLGADDNKFLADIMKNNPKTFEEDTPQYLLWQQQLEQASKPNSRLMRWHPLIIRWCLSIYHTSPAAYRQMSSKKNKFLVLPHVNTLKGYLNFTNPTSGFNPDVIDCLVEDSDIDNLEEWQKNVSLLFDEIKIKSGLAYKRSTGQLVGFTEMGDLNDEIDEFQRRIANEDSDGDDAHQRKFATYINVFMVRGIFTSLCYPFGYYAGTGFTGDQLFPMVWEATHVLESIGFKVRAWVCDGASPNRKLFKINSVGLYYTNNLFDLSRKIYFISDVPHLLKTTRNNLENSHGNRNSRSLKFNGMDIGWHHIVSVYEWDLGMNRASPGFRMLHKLTEDHIKLTPRHRMKVKYAANVLSNSVGCAMEHQGYQDRQETIKFVKMFDKAFDCLNVMRVASGGKEERKPYTDVNDSRFEFLESVLTYLDEWKNQIDEVSDLTAEERAKYCLSSQTDAGWHITIKSFVELSKMLLQENGVKYLLSEKFSQDPLEEHFSRHRRSAGCNENPTLAQFQQQEVALNIIQSNLIGDLRGNTSGRQHDNRPPIDITDTRLPRKKASSKSD